MGDHGPNTPRTSIGKDNNDILYNNQNVYASWPKYR